MGIISRKQIKMNDSEEVLLESARKKVNATKAEVRKDIDQLVKQGGTFDQLQALDDNAQGIEFKTQETAQGAKAVYKDVRQDGREAGVAWCLCCGWCECLPFRARCTLVIILVLAVLGFL